MDTRLIRTGDTPVAAGTDDAVDLNGRDRQATRRDRNKGFRCGFAVKVGESIAAALVAIVLAVGIPAAAQRPASPPVGVGDFAFAGMVDQFGRPMAPARLAGRHVLLNFIFTGCGDTCPLQTAELAATLKGLPPRMRRRLRIVSVSVDPQNDTPAALHAFAANFGANTPDWAFVTGNPNAMLRMLRRYDASVSANGRQVATMHGTGLVLLNAAGHEVRRYRALPLDRARLAQDLAMLDAFPKLDAR